MRAYGTARCASRSIFGDEAFVERMQALAEPRNSTDEDIPKIQRRKSRTLAQWLENCANREQALHDANTQSAMTMSAIARELGLSISRVSRLIAGAEEAKCKVPSPPPFSLARRCVTSWTRRTGFEQSQNGKPRLQQRLSERAAEARSPWCF